MLKVDTMECPKCGSAMSASKISWMCLECGHIEQSTGPIGAEAGGQTPPPDSSAPATSTQAPASSLHTQSFNDALPPSDAVGGASSVPDPGTLKPGAPVPGSDAINRAEPAASSPPTPAPHVFHGPSVAAAKPPDVSGVDAAPVTPVAPPVVMAQSTVAPQSDSSGPGQNHPKPLLIGGIVLVVILIIGAVAGKLFWYDPQNAPVAYFKKVAAAKTGTVQASLNYSTESQNKAASKSAPSESSNDIFGIGNEATLKVNGVYDVSDKTAAKADMKVGFKAGQMEIAGHIISLPKAVYFQVTNAGFLSLLGISGGNQWYKYPVNQDESTSCAQSKSSKAGNYFGAIFPTQIPVSKARRAGFQETIAGHATTHYTGAIDFKKLQKVVDAANKDLTADCKIQFTKDSYKDYVVSYDLWTSTSFDRMVLKIQNTGKASKSLITSTIDSSGYNQSVKIEAPKEAKDFSLLGGLGDGGGDPVAVPTPVDSVTTRDVKRKNSGARISAYLEESASNNNGQYPGGNGGETPSSFNATYLSAGAAELKDPSTKAAYVLPTPSGSVTACPALKPGVLSYGLSGRKYQLCIGLESGVPAPFRN